MSRRWGSVVVLAAMALFIITSSGQASITNIGPADPTKANFPASLTDNNGVTLTLCDDPLHCVVVAAAPGVDGFEGFYYLADGDFFSLTTGRRMAKSRMAIEGSTIGAVLPASSVFTRSLFTFVADEAPSGLYRIDTPYGSFQCNNDAATGTACKTDTILIANIIPPGGAGAPGYTSGPIAPPFDPAGQPSIFLGSPDGGLPAGFIGDYPSPPAGAPVHTIIPGPNGNSVTVTPLQGQNLGGHGVGVAVTISQFNVTGKILGNAKPSIYNVNPVGNMAMNRPPASPAQGETRIKTFKYFDANADPLSAVVAGLPGHCLADNTSVAGQVTVTCTPVAGTPQVTSQATLIVTDNGALSDNVVFSVVVNNLAPTVTPINNKTFNTTTGTTVLDNTVVSATDSDGNAIASMNATMSPSKSWFSFNSGTNRIIITGPIPAGDTGNYTVTVTATDDGATPATGSTSFTVTVGNPPPIEVSTGGGGGGGCAVAGSRGDWRDGVGAYGALLLAAIGIAVRRRRRER